MDTPNSKRKCIEASSSTEPPQPMDVNLLENNNENNEQNNNNQNLNENMNEEVKSIRLFKKMRGPVDGDVSDPVRQSFYWNDVITVDAMNEKYNKDYYGLFEVQHVTEVPMLDKVYIKITENNPDFVWNINNNYINTDKNIMENDPAGYNPLGVREFHVEIAVNNNRLKEINEFNTLNIGNESIDIASYNNAIVKYNQNNQIDPQEITNERRLRVVDEYEGEGKTVYDSNEKIFINSHKYTIEEENENCEENNEGFKKVLQTTIVPIMDKITIPEISSNKTVRYSIEDFNSIYSLSPGSQNVYRNDFIGFSQIDIPVNVNNKTVPLLATQDGLYRPSDIDPSAIGFSSVQVSTTTRSSGGGSGGDITFVKNLNGYTFTHNTNHPFSINEYNITQYPNTDYTGFDEINIDVGELENLDVNIYNVGNYKLNFNEGIINVMPVMTSDESNGIILTGTEQYNGTWNLWRTFDGIINDSSGYHTKSNVLESYLKIDFGEEPRLIEGFKLYQRPSWKDRSPSSIKIEGSDDDENYIELFNNNIVYENGSSLKYFFNNNKKYRYYNIIFYRNSNGLINFAEMELYKYSGGYKNVNVNVNIGDKVIENTFKVDTIQNNISNWYYPFNILESVVENMTSNNGTNCTIIDMINSHNGNYPWKLFDSNTDDYYENESGKQDTSFVISFNYSVCIKSFFIMYQANDMDYTIDRIKISGSNDNDLYDELFYNDNIYNEGERLKYAGNCNYNYYNIENYNDYSYYKIEVHKYNSNRYMIFRQMKLFDVEKCVGFDKICVNNDTYSKTSDPIVSDLQPNNQRVYVNTDNSSTHPYVRRNWMSIPLEDKVVKYTGKYIPGNINVGSGFYGIRSVTFESEGNEIYSCTQLFENNAVSGDMVDNWYINGDYRMQLRNEYNSVINVTPNTYRYFDSNTGDIGNYGRCRMIVSKTYPFIMNGFVFWMNTSYSRNDTINIYVSNDDHNYELIYSEYYYLRGYNWNEFKFYANDLMYNYYAIEFTFGWLTEMKLLYCTSGDIVNKIDNVYYNYKINIDQPGTYYYDKPVGYSGINNIIVNYSTGEPVSVSQTIVEDGEYTIVPPEGKRIINEVKLNVQCVRNEDVNVYNTITESGFYEIPQGFTGFNNFYVDIEPPQQQSGLSIDRFYNVNQNATVMVRDMTVVENRGSVENSWRLQIPSGYSVGIASFFLLEKEIRLLCIEVNNQSSRAVDEQWYTNFPSGPNARLSKKHYYKLFTPYQDSNLESYTSVIWFVSNV